MTDTPTLLETLYTFGTMKTEHSRKVVKITGLEKMLKDMERQKIIGDIIIAITFAVCITFLNLLRYL